ncbi:MAG: GNAT family N-acetyltransferase [Ruminococcaceae bacterium]|nr:GNAT family N-acetyltransferase [Oscillospiraceae bacterium]
MKPERIDEARRAAMAERLGCVFCDDGAFAEMSMDLGTYQEKTAPIDAVSFGFYPGNAEDLQELVAAVDDGWVKYFHGKLPIFCGMIDGKVVSFCIVDPDADTMLSRPDIRVGSIGCVGTSPAYRSRGIGLRMVDLATLYLQEKGCDKAYISYTHIDFWYARLGYETFARFSFS